MKQFKPVILFLCVMITVCCPACSDRSEEQLIPLEKIDVAECDAVDNTQTEQSDTKAIVATEAAVPKIEIPRMICVHICGAVSKPGVYTVEEGMRVFDVIETADGLTEEAAADYLNQAALVSDGQKIYVPTNTEIQEGTVPTGGSEDIMQSVGTDAAESQLININEATAEQLKELPGVGDSRANSIIAYRESHGGFGSKEEIMQVEGIKEGMYSKMKDRISIN